MIRCGILWKYCLRGYSILWNNGVSFLTLDYSWALSFEKITKIVCPPPPPPAMPMPLSRLCQTPRVINPSIMKTTAVVLCNCIINYSLKYWPHPVNGPLTAGLYPPHQGHNGGGGGNHFRDWGINCRNEIFVTRGLLLHVFLFLGSWYIFK